VIAVTLLAGCGSPLPSGFDAAAEKGKNYFRGLDAAQPSAPFVSDHVRLFPAAGVRKRYFTDGPEPGFDGYVVLYGRYELTMQLPVKFDAAGENVVGYGEPAFYLQEAEKFEDRCVSYNTAGARQFGPREWQRLVTAEGDFNAIGYPMVKDKPVAGFQGLMNEGGF
jgi:hypothetical protein